MSRTARDAPGPLQPAVTQRDIELEVAQCVGGVISPLLANVYLHRIDRAWRGAYGTLVRYADLCRTRHKSAYAEVRVMPTRPAGALVSGLFAVAGSA
jgi:hypothetical protein